MICVTTDSKYVFACTVKIYKEGSLFICPVLSIGFSFFLKNKYLIFFVASNELIASFTFLYRSHVFYSLSSFFDKLRKTHYTLLFL